MDSNELTKKTILGMCCLHHVDDHVVIMKNENFQPSSKTDVGGDDKVWSDMPGVNNVQM